MAARPEKAEKGLKNNKIWDGYEGTPLEEIEVNNADSLTEFAENDPEMLEKMAGAFLRSTKGMGQAQAIAYMNLPAIFDMVMQGATPAQIAKKLGMGIRTWNDLKNNNKLVSAVVEAAMQEQVSSVEQSLFNMTQPRKQLQQKVLYDGSVVDYEMTVQPDFNAVKFYLMNKNPQDFHDRKEVTVTHKQIVVDIIDAIDITDNVVDDEASEEETTNPLYEKRLEKPKVFKDGAWVEDEEQDEEGAE